MNKLYGFLLIFSCRAWLCSSFGLYFEQKRASSVFFSVSSSLHVGSSIVPVDGVGRISYGHCLYHASPFCSITCILFHQSIFLHLILYLLFPRLFPSSSSATTAHFKFQSLHYHILVFFPKNMTVPPYTACFSHPI